MKSYFLLLTVLFSILTTSSCKKTDPQPEEDLAKSYQGSYSAYYKKAGTTVTLISPTKPSYAVSIKIIPSGTNLSTLRVDETLNGTLYQTVFKNCSLKKSLSGSADAEIYSDKGFKIGEFGNNDINITVDINNLSTYFIATRD
jgi:hypothetical protein